MLISIIFAVLFSVGNVFFGMIIFPKSYELAYKTVYWVILFSLARSYYAILGLVTDYFGMNLERLKAITLSAIVSTVVVIYGVISIGILGAVIGVGVGYLVLGTILWIYIRNKFNV